MEITVEMAEVATGKGMDRRAQTKDKMENLFKSRTIH